MYYNDNDIIDAFEMRVLIVTFGHGDNDDDNYYYFCICTNC